MNERKILNITEDLITIFQEYPELSDKWDIFDMMIGNYIRKGYITEKGYAHIGEIYAAFTEIFETFCTEQLK
jgi:hypothetical protein